MANLQIGNMQGLPTELTSFLTTLQAQIMNVQNRTDQLERLAAENARLTTELDHARTTIANLQKQLGSQSAPEKNFSEISFSNPAGAAVAHQYIRTTRNTSSITVCTYACKLRDWFAANYYA
ncbi:hypothetical protein PHYBLDRAFT_145506 [Phycomyces blakesleeanus NRRL 1555(-)]|uniref:Uncharacterized protein n=1 Tax=Phycomyces blakesleeanus (strain ATCC 8743b / DSM 1359 / FGSC 10004 / NBRC 33097 / NRRL 1555) TaxID=763407 RepID=A0A162UCB1_PHYB8|nr:hypothetical protein PHYBLDRAFT_145506 [Phycomyces blakesleeanus NRRL 1555(-)]OAD74043.1 hypothetical protein PHYBLDRAFT_145506 [Phycomyces blakesleeanus NRRL 1555(-)]|eukprot:XP_018292083.1 hypothetical protein PHYBLDRAFT_145506 [Phycomyces blakesleeanus NRRL 1555(-)]